MLAEYCSLCCSHWTIWTSGDDRYQRFSPPPPPDGTQECASDYRELQADKCLHCSKGVRKTSEFSGSFYPVDRTLGVTEGEEDGPKVHLECWEAYEAKIAADRVAKEDKDLEAKEGKGRDAPA